MKNKEIKYYILSSLLIVIVGFSSIELATRSLSWLSGKGFTLALHELEPYDKEIDDLYQWHPFTGIIFTPKSIFQGGHPNQEKRALIITDQHGFLANTPILNYTKSANEIRIATIGASTTANINLSYDENWPGYLGSLVQQALPEQVIIYHAYNDLKAIRKHVTFKPDYSHIHTKPYGYHQKPLFLIRWLDHSMFYVRLRHQYREYQQEMKKLNALKNERLGKTNRLTHIPQEARETFAQHIRSLISIAKTSGSAVVLSSFATLNDPKLDYSKAESIEGLSQFQKQGLYGLMHFTSGLSLKAILEGLNLYNDTLRNIAIQEKTGWVDNASLVPHEDKYFVDRVHFSSEGAASMAKNLLPVVLEQLKKR